jgi:Domain of unknown function (DUF6471)
MPDSSADKEWTEKAKRLLKAELKRSDTTYEDLATKLRQMGFSETKASIANKLARGKYPASFLLATLKAIGRDTITVSDL